jgi:hypothetical protein
MLGNAQFYHRTIRKMVVVFGTMFNDLEIVRYTQSGLPREKQKVPLSYGPKERYLTQITSDPNLIKSINTVVPRMSFNLDSLEYDVSRKQVSTLQNFSAATNNGVSTQYLPVPYNFEFSLSIYVRNTEDGTQILEQILPFFTPDFNVVVDFIPAMDQKYNVPIILNSVASTVEYEGGMSDGTTRLIIWDLTFTAKSFIWPPVKSGKIINAANTNLNIDLTSRQLQKVYVDFANGNNVFTTGETLRDTANGFVGTVEFFSNTSLGTLVITDGNKYIQTGYTLTGDYSGAKYSVATLDINSVNATAIITEPTPNSALPNSSYGYIETIKEWPDTLS